MLDPDVVPKVLTVNVDPALLAEMRADQKEHHPTLEFEDYFEILIRKGLIQAVRDRAVAKAARAGAKQAHAARKASTSIVGHGQGFVPGHGE